MGTGDVVPSALLVTPLTLGLGRGLRRDWAQIPHPPGVLAKAEEVSPLWPVGSWAGFAACCHSEPLCCGGRCMPRGVRDPREWWEQRGPAWACPELDAGSWAFAQLAGRGVLARLVLGVPSLANSGRFQSPAVPCKSQVVGIVSRASRGHFLSSWVPPACPAPH